MEDIVEQVKPLLQKHGFSYSLTAETKDSSVLAICTITHRLGHSEKSEFRVPVDPQAFMNEQQKFASAYTYAKRYAFCNAFGILTADEDMDARIEKEKPEGPAKATEKTRIWWINSIQDIRREATQFAIDRAWIMPDEPMEAWPLDHVPVTKADAAAMRKEIEAQ